MNRVIALLASALALGAAASAATPGVRTGSFGPGERVRAPEPHAPAQISRAHVQTVALEAGRALVDLRAAGGSRLLVWLLPVQAPGARASATLTASIRTPGGRALAAAEARSQAHDLRRYSFEGPDLGLALRGPQQVVEVADAEPGLHQLALAGAASAVTVVTAEPDSALTLATWAAPLSRQPGQPVSLRAELRDSGGPLTGARVTARLAPPEGPAGEVVMLFDDGRHDDGAAGDGAYGAAAGDLPAGPAGLWTVRFEADGADGRGIAFARTGSGGFVAEPGAARLVSAAARRQGRGGLRVVAEADVRVAGEFRLDAVIAGAPSEDGSRPGVAWGERTLRLPSGRRRVVLEVPRQRLGAAGRGPLHVDVRLLSLAPIGVAGRTAVDVAP